ncbi:MAG: 50S ribosomal protein L4 [Planctomycetota bacterium]
MLKVPIYNMAGESQGEQEVAEDCLGGDIRPEVLRQAIVTYEANQRNGTACAKTRSETSYSNAKPWPQKHTGRARAGSRNSPIWVGGGVTFGPRPRDYSKKMNTKMKHRALASALIAKMRDDEVMIVDRLELSQPKTREMAGILESLGVERTFLVILPDHDRLLWRCTRNIPGSAMMAEREVNAYEMVKARDVIFTRDAFDQMVNRLEESIGQAGGQES